MSKVNKLSSRCDEGRDGHAPAVSCSETTPLLSVLPPAAPHVSGPGSGDAIDDPFHAGAGGTLACPQRQAADKVAPSGCCGGRGWEVTGTIFAGLGLAVVAVVGAAALAVGACAALVCAAAAESNSRRTVIIY